MASFRGQTRISAEWKGDLFESDMVRAFLEDVKWIMMSIVEGIET
jgi:hypothetical protein